MTTNNMKFEIGDRVRIIKTSGAAAKKHKVGEVAIVTDLVENHAYSSRVYLINGSVLSVDAFFESELELINTSKTMAQKIGSMMKRLLDADTQKLVKAGFINGDLELTSDGEKALMGILFDANKAALVAEAESVISEEKSN